MASFYVEVFSAILLFSLVFGMSATVEISNMRKQIYNSTALLIGAGLQFVILPFVGFLVVKIFSLPSEVGITLLVITSSPGGSYSNWWCSMFNADLALSVTMTALSTLLSTVMLPTNLVIYTRWTYSAAVVKSLDWTALFISLTVVISGIAVGLTASHRASNSSSGNDAAVVMRRRANRMGNVSGLALILLSVTVSSSDHQAAIWDQDAAFYTACALPPIIGLIFAVSLATYYQLDKPERVAVSIESCYQNTGIATTVALTMFHTETERATAMGVPLFYGMVEGVVILTFCLTCWKSGWTKAPANGNLCTIIATSYEMERVEDKAVEMTPIEAGVGSKHVVVGGQPNSGNDVVDACTLHDLEKVEHQKRRNGQKNIRLPTEKEDDVRTECSEPSYRNDDGSVADGIMITGSPGITIHGRKICLYDALEAPGTPETEVSTGSVWSVSDKLAADSEAQDQGDGPFGRRTLSGIRARATGYRPQTPFTEDDHENKLGLRDTRLPIVLSSDEEANTTSKSAVATAATTVSTGRTRRNYETLSTVASPCDESSSSVEGGSSKNSFQATEALYDAVDDCVL